MDVQRWIQVRSWHIIRETWDDVANGTLVVKTLCGIERMWDGTSSETFPADEKTCETCWRLAAKK